MKIIAMKNGPYIIESDGKKVALCRCGASNNKPYCDGSHQAINFNAEEAEVEV